MKTIQIKGSSGIRNTVSDERLGIDRRTGLVDLVDGVNVDLDDSGKLTRRLGRTQLSAVASTSLWSDGKQAFVNQAGTVKRINKDLTLSTIVSGVQPRVAYGALGEIVYWTDGLQSGRIEDNTNSRWGVQPPAATFLVSATFGDLPAGTYGVTVVFMRNGMESGAPRGKYVTIEANGGLNISNIPVSTDPTVSSKALYITRPDGEVFFRAAVLPNAFTSATIRGLWPDVLQLRTQFKTAAPAGSDVRFYNRRAYVVVGNAVYYSDPYEYELFDLRYNFLLFESEVAVFAPVSDGIFVATDSTTVFLQGDNPEVFNVVDVAQYGAVKGTLTYPETDQLGEEGVQGSAALWVSSQGPCLGLQGGQFVNLTSSRYVMPSARRGGGLFKKRGGTAQFVTTVFN